MDLRRQQLEAAKAPLTRKLENQFPALVKLRLPDGSSRLTNIVASCLDKAGSTQADLTIPKLMEAIARSLSASLYNLLVPSTHFEETTETWESVFTSVKAAVETALGGQAGLFGDLLQHTTLSLALPLLRGTRGRFMPPTVRFLGDVFVYLIQVATYSKVLK